MSKQLYALRSKHKKEEALWREVTAWSHEVYYPQIRVQPVNPRSRKVRPYFPGYLFVNIDLATVGSTAITWMPHSYSLVTFGSESSSVPEELIHTLRHRVNDVNASGGKLYGGLQPGEELTVQAGPFTRYEAFFDTRLPGSERVRVLLKLLSKRQVPLELPEGQIKRKDQH
jgi:transcription antitermination factor NusG